jgi:hypothetical protein
VATAEQAEAPVAHGAGSEAQPVAEPASLASVVGERADAADVRPGPASPDDDDTAITATSPNGADAPTEEPRSEPGTADAGQQPSGEGELAPVGTGDEPDRPQRQGWWSRWVR